MQSNTHEIFQFAWASGGGALIGALVGSLATGYFTLRAKQNEYLNDFYKIVIAKRVEAYERVEAFIQAYKAAIVDDDNESYHWPFASEKKYIDSLVLMGAAMDSGLWLSDEIFDSIQELNYLQFQTPGGEAERIHFGKRHYVELANKRESLEMQLALDMLDLHKVREFLKAKHKRSRGFRYVNLRPDNDD
jgi:hypothetical protein